MWPGPSIITWTSCFHAVSVSSPSVSSSANWARSLASAMLPGRAADALQQLDRLLASGEEPQALLPQMASTFRKFAAAARVFERAEQQGRRLSLRAALEQTGMPPFKLSAGEAQLKQIGRERAKQLYRWLLAADIELKGYNSARDRARRVLEILIVRLAKQAKPRLATREAALQWATKWLDSTL